MDESNIDLSKKSAFLVKCNKPQQVTPFAYRLRQCKRKRNIDPKVAEVYDFKCILSDMYRRHTLNINRKALDNSHHNNGVILERYSLDYLSCSDEGMLDSFERWCQEFGMTNDEITPYAYPRKLRQSFTCDPINYSENVRLFDDISSSHTSYTSVSLDRSLAQTNEIKLMKPKFHDNSLIWAEESVESNHLFSHMIPSTISDENRGAIICEPFRPVPTVIRELVRGQLHVLPSNKVNAFSSVHIDALLSENSDGKQIIRDDLAHD